MERQAILIVCIVAAAVLAVLAIVLMQPQTVPIVDSEGNVVGQVARSACNPECYECYTRGPSGDLRGMHDC